MTLSWWGTISVLVSYVGRYNFLVVQIGICSFLLVAIVLFQIVEISGRGSKNAIRPNNCAPMCILPSLLGSIVIPYWTGGAKSD